METPIYVYGCIYVYISINNNDVLFGLPCFFWLCLFFYTSVSFSSSNPGVSQSRSMPPFYAPSVSTMDPGQYMVPGSLAQSEIFEINDFKRSPSPFWQKLTPFKK